MNKQDRAWKDYGERFRREVLPKIMDSACSLIIAGGHEGLDVKQATEIGALLLLDKPLVVICSPGGTIPSRLRKAADVVIEDWDPADPASQVLLTQAMEQIGII